MAAQTKKNIIDDLTIILTRFQPTDDSRLDPNFLSFKIDQVRAELIIKQYAATNVIDYHWLSNVGLIPFSPVNMADSNLVACDCNISKAVIPQTITLQNKDGNLDLGIYSLISACGKTTYYPSRTSLWRNWPEGHTNNLFGWYARINTDLYVNKLVEQLKLTAILLNPEEGYLINSVTVPSGSIQNGVVYYVVQSAIFYNGHAYYPGDTFTGGAFMGVIVTTYTGQGVVYLNAQVTAYRDVDPYPAGGEMNRMIVLEILSKEFGIEEHQIADIRNDSKDDASKTQ